MDQPEGQDAPGGTEAAMRPEWVDAGGVRIEHVDHFALQRGEEEGTFVLVVGQLDLPLVLGDVEAQHERLKALPYVAVRIIGRYSLTLRRLEELTQLLARQAERRGSASEPQ